MGRAMAVPATDVGTIYRSSMDHAAFLPIPRSPGGIPPQPCCAGKDSICFLRHAPSVPTIDT